MAILKLQDGTVYTDLQSISRELAPLNIQLDYWAIGEDRQINQKLAKASLDDSEKEEVLQGSDKYFQQLKQEAGYQERDLIVLHPEVSTTSGKAFHE